MNLIGEDIKLMRDRYDEALCLQGIPTKYQYPIYVEHNAQGESIIDHMSSAIDTNIFLDSNPKIKTYKRYGWVVENSSDLPFLLHCSFNLPNVQKDCMFAFSGQYTGLPDRIFRVTELTYDLQAPDHLICQVIPVYDKHQTVGRTKQEIKHRFNKSNTFIQKDFDYRGDVYITKEETGEKEVNRT